MKTSAAFLSTAALAAAIALLRAVPAAAQEGPVVIKAAPLEEERALRDLPGAVSLVSLDETRDRAKTVPEILEELAGVEMKDYGGLGSYSAVSIRGAGGAQTQVLLDGVPLNQGLGGAVNFGDLSADALESIALYRGAAPTARFRASGMGGVVSLKTRAPKDGTAGVWKASAGPYGTAGASLFQSWAKGERKALVNVARQTAVGDFEFLDDRGTLYNDADDVLKKRRNNESRSTDFLAKWDAAEGRWDYGLSENLFVKNQGVPGLGSSQSSVAGLETHRNLLTVRMENQTLRGGTAGLSFDASWLYSREAFSDPLGEIGLGPQENRNRTSAYSFRSAWDAGWGDWNRIYASLTLTKETYKPADRVSANTVGLSSRRRLASFAAEAELFPLKSERLLVTPSLRAERLRDERRSFSPFALVNASGGARTETLWSPALGVRLLLRPGLALKANAGRAARPPGFYELYGDKGSVVGNPGLASEKGNNFDVGANLDFRGRPCRGACRFDLTYFDNSSRDLIVFTQNSQRTIRAKNAGRADIKGWEASLRLPFARRWTLHSNATFQEARNRSVASYLNGRKLPGRHDATVFSRLEYAAGPHVFFMEQSHADDAYLDQANLLLSAEKTLTNLGWRVRRDEWAATLEVKNIGDRRAGDVLGYPLPGRGVYAALTRTWD